MSFTVTLHPSAETALASIWLESQDRNAVTDAAATIESTLKTNPESAGEDFYGDRLLVVLPLAAVYEIRTDDRIVRVLDFWHR